MAEKQKRTEDALRDLPELRGAEVSTEEPATVDEYYDEAHIWAPPVVVRVPYGDGGAEAASRLLWEMVAAVEGAVEEEERQRDAEPVYVRAPKQTKGSRGG